MTKKDKCRCGKPLISTETKPVWVHCEDPFCDYVVMHGDWMIDRIFNIRSENKFAKSGPRKGEYIGSPIAVKITDIKKNYREKR